MGRKWLWTLLALAALSRPAAAAVFSQGYPAEGSVSPGMILSLSSSGKVEPATTENVGSLFGVAVEQAGAAVTVKSSGDNQVQVVSSGRAAALVSDLNGQIKKGDPITASPIKGVGMKIGSDDNQNIIGVAQDDATGGTTQQIQVDGKPKDVKVTRVPALVAVTFYTSKASPLTYLQQAGTTVAGKPISTTKALLSALVLLVAIMSVSVLLYTAIRSSLISIGRNPLSESAVRHELLRVLLVAPLILGAALVLIYAILKT